MSKAQDIRCFMFIIREAKRDGEPEGEDPEEDEEIKSKEAEVRLLRREQLLMQQFKKTQTQELDSEELENHQFAGMWQDK